MAYDKKNAAPKFIGPKAPFKFPKLSEPDYGSKDYPKPDGEFSTKQVMKADAPETKALIAKLQPFYDEALANAEIEFKALKAESRKSLGKVQAKPFYTEVLDQETEEPTGDIEFKFSMKYSGVYKKGPKAGKTWKRVPDLFDAAGTKLPFFDKQMNPISGMPGIWGGTVGRISFELGLNKEGKPGYFIPATGAAGLSLRLQAVRIIDLVTGGSRSAADYGFEDEEEGGYTFDAAAAKANEDTTETTTETKSGVADTDDNPDF